MLEEHGKEWGDKVRIIGLSIDKTKDVLEKHVQEKGWKSVEHYHRAESTCSKDYGVNGVPHVMLIDTDGKIAFKGHPASRKDLVADFNALLKGEKLTGEGCGPAGPGEEDSESKEMDVEAVAKELDAFEELGNEFCKNDVLKAAAKTMPRAFCVMSLQQNYSPATGKNMCKYLNYRVLIGSQANIDLLKKEFEEKVKGSFKVVLNERVL